MLPPGPLYPPRGPPGGSGPLHSGKPGGGSARSQPGKVGGSPGGVLGGEGHHGNGIGGIRSGTNGICPQRSHHESGGSFRPGGRHDGGGRNATRPVGSTNRVGSFPTYA